MKFLIALAALTAVALAAPAPQDSAAVVLQQDLDNIGVDGYRYNYQTSNGISSQAEGTLQQGPEGPFVASRGSYAYQGPDGQNYQVNWVADENGFQPQGAHLPA